MRRGRQGRPDPTGPTGPTGAGETGPTGPTGPTGGGLTAVEQVTGTASADIEGPRTVTVDCTTAGKVVIGGGFVTTLVSAPNAMSILISQAADINTWTVSGDSLAGTGADTSYALAAFAICAQP